MSFQKNKNIKLFSILAILVLVIVTLSLMESSTDSTEVDRSLFAIDDPTQVTSVNFNPADADSFSLNYNNGIWQLGQTQYKVDPQRLKVLFAIVKQMRIRRPVANQLADSINRAIKEEGVEISFNTNNEKLKSIEAIGNSRDGVTYIKFADSEDIYIVEIPGYKSYLYGIFSVDKYGWRDPLVYDVNWRNMQSVTVYSVEPEDTFKVKFKDGSYGIEGIQKTDTTKLFDYLDDVSQLYVDDYLTQKEANDYAVDSINTLTSIVFTDVGNNNSSLEILAQNPNKEQYLVRIDSVDYALLSTKQITPVLKKKQFFQHIEK